MYVLRREKKTGLRIDLEEFGLKSNIPVGKSSKIQFRSNLNLL